MSKTPDWILRDYVNVCEVCGRSELSEKFYRLRVFYSSIIFKWICEECYESKRFSENGDTE